MGTTLYTLALAMLLFINGCNGKVANSMCRYQYTQQPESSVKCNPYGERLQLHCGATGPLIPTFHLEWYNGPSSTGVSGEINLATLPEYHIQNIVLDVMGETRSVSSILRTNEIASDHTDSCFWCRIEFNGVALPVNSNTLCIESEEYYSDTTSCNEQGHSGTMLVNTSVLCVNISEDLENKLKSPHNERISPSLTLVPNQSVQPTQTDQEARSKFGSTTQEPAHTHDNIVTQSLHTINSVAMTNSQTQAKATPSVTQNHIIVSHSNEALIVTTQTTTGVGMDETVPRSSFEGALYAAIVVCIMFVGVIVILIVVIVCLSKRKCSFLSQTGRRMFRQLAMLTGRRSTEGNTNIEAVNGQVDANSTSGEQTTQLDVSVTVHRDKTNESTDGAHDHLNQTFNERNVDDWKLTHHDDQIPPELPPKPKKTNTLQLKNYDHLEPIKTDNDSYSYIDSSCSTRMDASLNTSTEIVPKKPARSRSGDHFYHTLESSNEGSGLLRSATASHTSSQVNELGVSQSSDGMSGRLKELFDDPRYAILFVDSQEDGECVSGLTRRRDFSRSSPSIVTLLQPQAPDVIMKRGASERRSLRLPKWLSANRSHEIYDN